MNLLMKQDRPDGENNKLYYLMDEQWTKITAYDMRSALIDDKKEKQNSHMSPAAPSHMSHLKSPASPLTSEIPYALGISILQEKY